MSAPHDSEISVVVPVYGCVSTLNELAERVFALEPILGRIQLVLVDDASTDGSRDVVRELDSRFVGCTGLRIPRNRGQHWALAHGIEHSTGKIVVTMDCDLENYPEDIPKLVTQISHEVPCVVGSSTRRGSRSFTKQILRKLYGYVLGKCYGNDLRGLGVSSFSFVALNGDFARNIVNTSAPGDPMSLRILDSGVEIATVEVETTPNVVRESSYSFSENLFIAIKSLLLAGKGFQLICIRMALVLGFLTIGSSTAAVLLVFIKASIIFQFVAVALAILFLATCLTFIVILMISVSYSSTIGMSTSSLPNKTRL